MKSSILYRNKAKNKMYGFIYDPLLIMFSRIPKIVPLILYPNAPLSINALQIAGFQINLSM